MHLSILRHHHTPYGIHGQLVINDHPVCDTLEHPELHLPQGTYTIIIAHNPRLNRKVPYLLPTGTTLTTHKRTKKHPHISIGNGPFSKQCRQGNILIGHSTLPGLILQSSPTFARLIDRLDKAQNRHDPLLLTIL